MKCLLEICSIKWFHLTLCQLVQKLLTFQRSILPPLSRPSSPRKIPMLSKILALPSYQHSYSWCWDLIKADTGNRSTSFCSTLFSVPFFLDYLTLMKEAVYPSETSLTNYHQRWSIAPDLDHQWQPIRHHSRIFCAKSLHHITLPLSNLDTDMFLYKREKQWNKQYIEI